MARDDWVDFTIPKKDAAFLEELAGRGWMTMDEARFVNDDYGRDRIFAVFSNLHGILRPRFVVVFDDASRFIVCDRDTCEVFKRKRRPWRAETHRARPGQSPCARS